MRRTFQGRAIGLVAAGSLALGVVLTACGGSEKPSGSAATPDQQPAAAASAAPSAVSGGTSAGTSQPQPQPQTQAQAQPQATAAARSDAALGGLPSSKSCLIGEWEVQDLQGYMNSLLNQAGNRITSVTGTMRMSAKPDGTITQNVSKVVVSMVTGTNTMAVTMDGNITAAYTEDSGKLTFSNIGGTLTTSATLDGQQLLAPTNALDNSFFGQENSRIDYQCKGDTLSFPLTLTDRQIDGLTFRRTR